MKNKYFLVLGSLLLTSVALLASKPGKNLTLYYTGNFKQAWVVIGSPTLKGLDSWFFTSNASAPGARTVILMTSFGSRLATLMTDNNGTNKLYYY